MKLQTDVLDVGYPVRGYDFDGEEGTSELHGCSLKGDY